MNDEMTSKGEKKQLLSKYEAGGLHTGWTVQTEAGTDQQVPVPQHSPQQVTWASRQLSHLLGRLHFLPSGAFWDAGVDALPEPHLKGESVILMLKIPHVTEYQQSI